MEKNGRKLFFIKKFIHLVERMKGLLYSELQKKLDYLLH